MWRNTVNTESLVIGLVTASNKTRRWILRKLININENVGRFEAMDDHDRIVMNRIEVEVILFHETLIVIG